MKLYDKGVYLVNGSELIEDGPEALAAVRSRSGQSVTKESAAQGTIAYGILKEHNTSGNLEHLQK